MGLTRYKAEIDNLSNNKMLEEFAKQNHTNSVIASKKFANFKSATILFLTAFFTGLVILFLLQLEIVIKI